MVQKQGFFFFMEYSGSLKIFENNDGGGGLGNFLKNYLFIF